MVICAASMAALRVTLPEARIPDVKSAISGVMSSGGRSWTTLSRSGAATGFPAGRIVLSEKCLRRPGGPWLAPPTRRVRPRRVRPLASLRPPCYKKSGIAESAGARAMRIGPQHGITRRGLLGAALSSACVAGAAPEKSKVVIARDPALRATGGTPDSGRVMKLLDRAMQSFYGVDSPIDAWKKVVRPGEVVGLK